MGTYNKTPVAMLSNILRLPSMALSYSSTAKAASGMYSDKYCGYAKRLFLWGSGSSEDPAVNMAWITMYWYNQQPGKHVSRGSYSKLPKN